MGIREAINLRRPIVIAACVAVLFVAFIFIGRASTSDGLPIVPAQSYFTTDDGATFFAGPADLIPPFMHAGKQAVKAQVYACGQTRFVGYLIRFTPDAKKQLESAKGVGVGAIRAAGTEIKAPLTGDEGWINSNDDTAEQIYALHCPDGSSDAPNVALP